MDERPCHDLDTDKLDGGIVCRRCGKTDDEIDEQEDPVICWGEEDGQVS